MADLSPDLSPYAALSKSAQSGLGAMDLGSILGLIQRGRQLQTQSGIADAIRANPNDPTAAYGAAAKNPNVFMGPEDVAQFVHAQRAQSELGQWQMGEATSAISSLLTKQNATLDDWQPIKLMLQRYGIPNDMLDQVEKAANPKNGLLDHDSLVKIHNFSTANAALPGQAPAKVTGPYGTTTIPSGQALYGNPSAAPGTGPPPAGPPSAGAPIPSPRPPSAGATGQTSGAQAPEEEDPAAAATRNVRQRYEGGYGASGGAVTTAPPGSEENWNASTKLYMGTVARDYRGDVLPMEKAIELLRKNPNLTGQGMTEFNNIKNAMHSLGLIPDDKMKETQDFESLGKYFSGFANNASLGGTDARMFQQIAASPGMTKLGSTNLNLARVILAMRRMQQVGLTEFKNQRGADGRPLPAGYYNDWMNDWAARQDPMGFVWDTMSNEEQKAYGRDHWTGKDPNGPAGKELKRFEASRAAAQRSPGVTSDGQ